MINKQIALEKLSALVSRFGEQINSYKNPDYNETQTRRDFIDPFFSLLGWDVDNQNGYAEAYREVIHEDKIRIGGATKAPDYSFRLPGGKRLFFVEAKKPSVFVKGEILPAYQVRRYGWNAKLPISIITDFEEFAIYDCTVKPDPADSASVARMKYLTFNEYISEFDFLWDTFSKEHVLKGSFDKFIEGSKGKKGTATVDKEFLKSLDNLRTFLAASIIHNNKNLTEAEINFAVQQTIDRIIFLRIAEDRNIEPYGNLKDALISGDFYTNLFRIFVEADQKYNSGLFDFKKDKISPHLIIENKVIKKIINDLYYPESPYEFSVLPVEILGSVYEQFLGKTISITPAHHVKIEEKPEVRKAGGVYYTPQYIVDYIVKNTVGIITEGKSPKEISKIKILDPACGSGSFLIGAYQFLLDWHKDYFTTHPKTYKNKKDNPLTPDGNLTTAEKKKILLNNIYGVDIDVNAVEVTKLSLLLKCLEGETRASVEFQLSMFSERLLPSLDNNIKDGNSLIDTDYYDTQLDFGEDKKVKPFNWQKAFPEVFNNLTEISDKQRAIGKLKKAIINSTEAERELVDAMKTYMETIAEPNFPYGIRYGFDIVIGNPPYGASYGNDIKHYLSTKYSLPIPIADTFLMFLNRAFHISRQDALISFILPSSWLYMPQYNIYRKFLLNQYQLQEVQLFRKPVFEKVTVEVCTIIAKNCLSNNSTKYCFKEVKSDHDKIEIEDVLIKQEKLFDDNNLNLILSGDLDKQLFEKIKMNSVPLKQIALIVCGLTPYRLGKGNPKQTQKIVKERLFDATYKKNKSYRRYLMGRDFQRYSWHIEKERWISYGEWLAEPRFKAPFNDEKKIIIRQTADSIIAHLDTLKYLSLKNVHNLRINDNNTSYEYLLGVLNSKLINWWYQKLIPEKGRVFAEVKIINLEKIPIKLINQSIEKEKIHYSEVVKLVEKVLQLNQEKYHTKLQSEKDHIQTKIDYCEQKINTLVYSLYNLTPPEIHLIEGE